ncbi:hypothetical protein SAMN02982990_02504 [Photorhabdus luminescens]|uniref:IS982 family transposase n=1 Tax=Photorhabdus luminescens TaxID=29488 RepID=A0A1G5QW37_PHOLU|nr:hypothetical protein SAMN02982990_02504 [Photorhabdus luminescens]
MDKLVELFCDVDDFCRVFIPLWEQQGIEEGHRQRRRHGRMSASEIMTIVIAFHMSHYRDFKNFYFGLVRRYPQQDFPTLLNYTRFLAALLTRFAFELVSGLPDAIPLHVHTESVFLWRGLSLYTPIHG